MSIPRAKITRRFAICEECDETPFPEIWFGRVLSLGDIADSAREHLRDAHGVRTVGSLTADDIGKWIETDFAEGKLRYVSHEIDALGDARSLVEVGLEPEAFVSSSTVCRVTEAKP